MLIIILSIIGLSYVSFKYRELDKIRNICGIAQRRLEETQTEWSHVGFRKMAERNEFVKYCPHCKEIGENLAKGQTDIKQVYDMWRQSPTHNKNLTGNWTDRCLVYGEKDGVNYYVEIYAN